MILNKKERQFTLILNFIKVLIVYFWPKIAPADTPAKRRTSSAKWPVSQYICAFIHLSGMNRIDFSH